MIGACPEASRVNGHIRFATIDGDGVGPEIMAAARTVLAAAAAVADLEVDLLSVDNVGARSIDGTAVDVRAVEFYENAFSEGLPVLTGPAGGRFVYERRARWDLYYNLIPIKPLDVLADASIVRPERAMGADQLVVRSNIEGFYQGSWGRRESGRVAFQEGSYTTEQVARLLKVAVGIAAQRRGRLAVVTKPSGLPTISALWTECAVEAAAGSDVVLDVIEQDNACYQVVADPHRFDVIATPNMIGDVLADTAAILLGSRGMEYCVNLGDRRAVYQTGHGAALDIAGTDTANPIAQIRALAWLLRDSLNLGAVSDAIERAVVRTLADGIRTADIAGPSSTIVGTRAMATAIAERVTMEDE